MYHLRPSGATYHLRPSGATSTHLWILTGLLLLTSPAWAGTGIPLPTTVSCNQIFAEIGLPGSIEGEIILTFEDPVGIDGTALELTAEIVDPEMLLQSGRLPADVFVPSDFPVVIKVEPPPGSGLSFSGQVQIEIVAESLDFEANTPLRLFRARTEVGPFEEISQSIGTGSYRARAAGGSFSEFLIGADLRPLNRVIAAKFIRLDGLLIANGGAIDDLVEIELNEFLDAAQVAYQAGDVDQAISSLEEFIDSVIENSDDGIPDDWDPGLGLESIAGALRSAAATLRHSLVQKKVRAPVTTGTITAEIDVDATRSVTATLRFGEGFDLDLSTFELTPLLVDPKDPDLLDRLPAGVQIPSEFPVLLNLSPGSGSEQGFRGEWSLELETDDLEFVGDSPLRLFKAPDGGAFEDITRSVGLGSYRARAAGGSFSEFLIVLDLRPVDDVIDAKFDRVSDLLTTHAGAIEPTVLAQLVALIAQARLAYNQGQLEDAIDGVKDFRDTVDDNSEENIPSLWRSDGLRINVAGLLTSAAQTLKFSLALKDTPLTADPADVNRDGNVDVQDVLFLINLVFGEPDPE